MYSNQLTRMMMGLKITPSRASTILKPSSPHCYYRGSGRTFAIYNPPPSTHQPIAVKIGGPGGGQGGQIGALGFPATYNELPVPSGSWEKYYKEQDQKYTRHLMIGSGMFVVTIYTVSRMVFFNWGPPPLESEDDEDDLCKVQVEVKKCN